MAVDYFHYLVVSGPAAAVRDFSDRISLVTTRRVAGVTHQSTVPFSFESLYALARLDGDEPCDPFDVTRWPIVQRGRDAEVRYRFHTRSLELHPLLKKLSRAMRKVSFGLVSHCLDDGDFGAFAARAGRLRGRWLGGNWREPFWQRAASEYNMTIEQVYEDDRVQAVAESWMRDEAVKIATGTARRYQWTGGRVYRDLDVKRAEAIARVTQILQQIEES